LFSDDRGFADSLAFATTSCIVKISSFLDLIGHTLDDLLLLELREFLAPNDTKLCIFPTLVDLFWLSFKFEASSSE